MPNPALKDKKRELEQVKARLAKAEQAYGQKAHDNPERDRRTVRGFKISHAKLGKEIRTLRALRDQLLAELGALPKRVPVRQVMDGQPVVRLERERKVITDALKMVAYRTETQLANLVGPLLRGRADEARKFVRQLLNLPADILPDHTHDKLVVRLHSLSTPRENRAVAALCDVLNDLKVRYPGTPLRLVLEAPQKAPES